MKKSIIVAVVGLTGSGKDEATGRFVARGFMRFGFNDAIYEELDRLNLERNQENERPVRENLRKQFGMGVAAERIMPRVEEAVSRGENVVIVSLYSWAEYKIVKDKFGEQFKVLAVYAPPYIRYERLVRREVRPLTPDEARSRDYAEIENIEKAGPITMADWTIQNIGPKEEFFREVDGLIDKLLS